MITLTPEGPAHLDNPILSSVLDNTMTNKTGPLISSADGRDIHRTISSAFCSESLSQNSMSFTLGADPTEQIEDESTTDQLDTPRDVDASCFSRNSADLVVPRFGSSSVILHESKPNVRCTSRLDFTQPDGTDHDAIHYTLMSPDACTLSVDALESFNNDALQTPTGEDCEDPHVSNCDDFYFENTASHSPIAFNRDSPSGQNDLGFLEDIISSTTEYSDHSFSSSTDDDLPEQSEEDEDKSTQEPDANNAKSFSFNVSAISFTPSHMAATRLTCSNRPARVDRPSTRPSSVRILDPSLVKSVPVATSYQIAMTRKALLASVLGPSKPSEGTESVMDRSFNGDQLKNSVAVHLRHALNTSLDSLYKTKYQQIVDSGFVKANRSNRSNPSKPTVQTRNNAGRKGKRGKRDGRGGKEMKDGEYPIDVFDAGMAERKNINSFEATARSRPPPTPTTKAFSQNQHETKAEEEAIKIPVRMTKRETKPSVERFEREIRSLFNRLSRTNFDMVVFGRLIPLIDTYTKALDAEAIRRILIRELLTAVKTSPFVKLLTKCALALIVNDGVVKGQETGHPLSFEDSPQPFGFEPFVTPLDPVEPNFLSSEEEQVSVIAPSDLLKASLLVDDLKTQLEAAFDDAKVSLTQSCAESASLQVITAHKMALRSIGEMMWCLMVRGVLSTKIMCRCLELMLSCLRDDLVEYEKLYLVLEPGFKAVNVIGGRSRERCVSLLRKILYEMRRLINENNYAQKWTGVELADANRLIILLELSEGEVNGYSDHPIILSSPTKAFPIRDGEVARFAECLAPLGPVKARHHPTSDGLSCHLSTNRLIQYRYNLVCPRL